MSVDSGDPEPSPQQPADLGPRDGSGRSASGRSRRQRKKPSARRPGRRWIGGRYSTVTVAFGSLAVLLALVLTAGSLAVYMKYREVWDSINHVNVSADLHGKRPPADPNAMNILLIGSDSRTGENGKIGGTAGIGGARSDTVMLLHIAPGAHQVVVISIPRDSVVPILACTPEAGTSGQTAEPGQVEQINATFAYGGPGCLWETVEQTTGIHIDDFIELTFVGFEKAIDALGGVNVCLPAAVDDPMSGLRLPAGEQHIYGSQALAFWRTREDIGMGDDLQRIQRDQFLMAALVQGIEHSGLLGSPGKMLSVIDALTKNRNITFDDSLTPGTLLHLAGALHGISSGSIQFVTVPWTAYVNNSNWVQWLQPGAGNLFSAIAHDTTLPKTVKAAKTKKGVVVNKTVTYQPSQVQVTVLNGSTTSELATTTSAALTTRGFDVVGQPGDAATDTYVRSVIKYASAADLPKAQLLAAAVGTAANVRLELDPQLGSSALTLILGSSFTALQPAATSQSTINNIASTYDGITGSVNICDDQNAFAGPDGE
jgi:LCP family protein required for cell wall assembly